jgi:hypothetical protein
MLMTSTKFVPAGGCHEGHPNPGAAKSVRSLDFQSEPLHLNAHSEVTDESGVGIVYLRVELSNGANFVNDFK